MTKFTVGPWEIQLFLEKDQNLVISAILNDESLSPPPSCSLKTFLPSHQLSSSSNFPISLLSLPVELLDLITSFLDDNSLSNFGSANHLLSQLCFSPSLWRSRFIHSFSEWPFLEMSWH